MSILTDADRAEFDTPQKRIGATAQAIKLMIREFNLTPEDVAHCREETRSVAILMRNHHVRQVGAGALIDDVLAKCDMLDAVFEFVRREP